MLAKTALLVEDNPDDEELTLRAFRQLGIADEIVVARDGAEALDYLFGTGKYQGRDVSAVPSVVLLDLKLPMLDGFEVLSRIRSHEFTRFLPVVILSSSSEDQDIGRSYSLGANSYIRKPVNFDKFMQAAECLGRYWFTLNERPLLFSKPPL
ncbi:MAG TPA: response regulator [Burkholderiales bacterium]|nr:response regulator [Burkholderiales bacterium]